MPEPMADTLEERALALFRARARVGLWVMIGALAVFIAADLVAGQEELVSQLPLKAAQIPLALGSLFAIDRGLGRRHARGLILALLVVNAVAMVPIGVARGDAATAPVLLSLATLSAGFLLPWGPIRQGVYATVAASG
jgi:hypothetical protein